jgi:hypothetical protein
MLSLTQFVTLFLGAFGKAPGEHGFEVDASGPEPVAKKGGHAVSLYVVDGNAIEWRVDGKTLVPFTLNGRDERGAARKADSITKLDAAIG